MDRPTDRIKKKKTISLLSVNLSINRSLLLYLSFALIREKISEYHVTLKTEAHYILLVITSEFLPHLPAETVANGSADWFISCELYFFEIFFFSTYSWKTNVMPQGCWNYLKWKTLTLFANHKGGRAVTHHSAAHLRNA